MTAEEIHTKVDLCDITMHRVPNVMRRRRGTIALQTRPDVNCIPR
jgi:hypothetical protein